VVEFVVGVFVVVVSMLVNGTECPLHASILSAIDVECSIFFGFLW